MQLNKIVGGILLVSCTTIGGGLLALPASTIEGGFYPTILTMGVCWFFLTVAALCLLEVTLWTRDRETNLISMAGSTLGPIGKVVAWITTLLLLYALICAYLTASGSWLETLIKENLQVTLSSYVSLPIIAIVMGLVIFFGSKVTDYLNRFFSIGLILAFIVLISIGLPHVHTEIIDKGNIAAMPNVIPLIITTFGFSIVIPSLSYYMNHDKKSLLIAILVGSLIPLAFYLIWEFVTLGTLSIEGPNGLSYLVENHSGDDGTQVALALENITGSHLVMYTARGVSIFAIMTSLIGVSWSLFHFLADGLQVSQKGVSGLNLFILTFLPPTIIVLFFPGGFGKILSFGGIFVATLLGILPILMAWSGRYKHQYSGNFKVWGGKGLLLITGLFFLYTIVQQIASYF